MRAAAVAVVAVLALHVVACGSSTPLAPSLTTSTAVPPPPVTTTTATASVSSLSPSLGSTGGATAVIIKGAGLAATVTFGGVPVQGRFDSRFPNALMLVYTPPHAAGTVDVVVGGLTGPSVTLAGAFRYASPEEFDFSGNWSGFGNNGQDTAIQFTIRDNQLISASCEGIPGVVDGRSVSFSPPVAVTNSAFSYASEDGVVLSGRIVAPNMATGVIRLGPCTSDAWYASKP